MFASGRCQINSEDKDILTELLLSIVNRENVEELPHLKQLGSNVTHHILELPNALQLNNKTINRIRLICSLASLSLHLILYTNAKEKLPYPITYEEYTQLTQMIIGAGGFVEKIIMGSDRVHELSFWTNNNYSPDIQLFYRILHEKMLDLFLSTLPPDKATPLTIIELGCGNARLLGECYVAAKERGYEVVAIGIDPNAGQIKDRPEENPLNKELQLFQQPASSAPDILASNFPHVHLGKVFCLLSGYLTLDVSRGSKEALQLLTSIYDKIDVLIWAGLTPPLLTKKSLTPNFHVILDSYGNDIIYKLIKKTFEEKRLYYSEKLAHKTRLDLSHEFTSVVDILDGLSRQDKSKIESFILIDANLQDVGKVLDRLSQLENLKEVYFELSQLKKLNKTPYFINFFIKNKIEIKLLNSHDKYQTTYLSVSEVEKISPKAIISFFASPPNSLLNNRRTLIEHLDRARELLKRTHQSMDKSHKFYNELMNLYGILSDKGLDSKINLKISFNMLFRLGVVCTNVIPTQVFGNKYDNALFFLKNLADPIILTTTFNALKHSYDGCSVGHGLKLLGMPYSGQMHSEFSSDDEAIIDLAKIIQQKKEEILESNLMTTHGI